MPPVQHVSSGPRLAPDDYQPLVPLRVDVSLAGSNKASPSTPSLRIVDTILLDPWVWPLKPNNNARLLLLHSNDNDNDDARQQQQAQAEWIEDNARFLAHNLLTDLEVQGMGRTVRHFTNRAEIWSVELQKRVMDQLRPQLQQVAEMRKNVRKRGKVRFVKESNKKDDDDNDDDDDDDKDASSCAKRSRTNETQQDNKRDENIKQQEPEQKEGDSSAHPLLEETTQSTTNTTTLESNKPIKQESSDALAKEEITETKTDDFLFSHLVPIKIRLSVHGVRIHDDCWWDPTMLDVTPLDYAMILAKDLKLSQEAVQAIAVDIAEQLYGSPRSAELPAHVQVVDERSVVKPDTRTTAAWSLDSRTHISHVAHLVAQHRQP